MQLHFKPLLAVTATVVIVLGAAAPSFAAGPQSSMAAADAKERSRLEELFIWKTSEELRLAPSDEAKFTDAIHAINKRRRAANAKMDVALADLAAAHTKPAAEKALVAHRAALRDVQAVQTSEIDKLRPLLGAEKLAQYLVAKSTILEKLKIMLAAPQATLPAASATAAAPKATESKSRESKSLEAKSLDAKAEAAEAKAGTTSATTSAAAPNAPSLSAKSAAPADAASSANAAAANGAATNAASAKSAKSSPAK